MLIVGVVLVFCLALIAFQDFTKFKVSLFLYVGTIILAAFISATLNEWRVSLTFALTNLAILFVQLILVWFYLILKYKKKSTLFGYIGPGDLLFFLTLSLSFSPFNFIVFQIVNFILILAIHLVLMKIRKKEMLVPLAGYQALFLIAIVVLGFFKYINRFDDSMWELLINHGRN